MNDIQLLNSRTMLTVMAMIMMSLIEAISEIFLIGEIDSNTLIIDRNCMKRAVIKGADTK